MSGRQSAATEQALALIGKPRKAGGLHNAFSAAKEAGIDPSTIYRALARRGVSVAEAIPKEAARDAKHRKAALRYAHKK